MRVALLVLPLAVGCGVPAEPVDTGVPDTAPTGPTSCTDLPLTVEIGTGDDAFVPLADGDPVVMVHGPQGGWHVDVSARIGNTHQVVALRPSVTLNRTGEQVAGDQQQSWVGLAGFDGCSGTIAGQRAFVDDHEPTDLAWICALAGQPATVGLWVNDTEDGRTVEVFKPVTLALDPADDC